MGFTARRRTYQLPLGDDFAGLEATVSSVSIGEYLKLSGLSGEPVGITYAVEQFLANLVDWNLEDEDGKPIPTSQAGEQDKELVFALTSAWVSSLHGVPAPLEPSSPAGEPSLEESMPMETLSAVPVPS